MTPINLSLFRLRLEMDKAQEALDELLGQVGECEAIAGAEKRYRAALRAYSRANPGPC